MYEIRLEEPIRRIEVEAIPIRFKGFEFAEFLLTQCDGSYRLENGGPNAKGKYIISEAITGRHCFGAFDNPEEAYYEVNKRLNVIGALKVRETIDKTIRSDPTLQ